MLFDLLRSFECLGSIILTSGVRCTAEMEKSICSLEIKLERVVPVLVYLRLCSSGVDILYDS